MTAVRVDSCRLCGVSFEQERRSGRPRETCGSCAAAAARRAAKKRAYYEANKAEIAAKQRAYREARKGGLKTVTCNECDEHLARRTEDGLCGFCRQGIAA